MGIVISRPLGSVSLVCGNGKSGRLGSTSVMLKNGKSGFLGSVSVCRNGKLRLLGLVCGVWE